MNDLKPANRLGKALGCAVVLLAVQHAHAALEIETMGEWMPEVGASKATQFELG